MGLRWGDDWAAMGQQWSDIGAMVERLSYLPTFRPSYGPISDGLTRPVSGDGHHAVVVLAQSSFS